MTLLFMMSMIMILQFIILLLWIRALFVMQNFDREWNTTDNRGRPVCVQFEEISVNRWQI